MNPLIKFTSNCCLALCALVLVACSSDKDEVVARMGNGLTDISAFNSEGEYADVLADCVAVEYIEDLCTLATLPYIGQRVTEPEIDDIMDRVVVSHDWMATRFEEVLHAIPDEMLPMFASVTAIVIDSDIRPSHFIPNTGAIYLDPGYLFRTPQELETINLDEDFRADFSDPLNFRSLSRYIKNGYYAYEYWRFDEDGYRTLLELRYAIVRLLLHELAHAVDFMHPSQMSGLSLNQTPGDAVYDANNPWVSERLLEQDPLNSEMLKSLGQVMFRGQEATESEAAYTALEVGQEFEADGANDDYAYSDQYEDVAMLFEVSMMRYFYDLEHEIVFTDVPSNPEYCDAYQIAWGAINRIGHVNVKDRARLVVSEILPNLEIDTFFDSLPDTRYTSGDWCLYNPNSFAAKSDNKRAAKIRPDDLKRVYTSGQGHYH